MKQKKDVFQRLARHLDDLPAGFPATKEGTELRILRRLFTPEEAELALSVTLIPESALIIGGRLGISEEEAAARLEDLSRKGLIFRLAREGRPNRYMANQFVIGIWEYQVDRLSPGLIEDFNQYVPHLLSPENWGKNPQLRTVPVNRSLDVKLEALPYENARRMVESQTRFLEAPCICRQEKRIVGEGCDCPEGSCLVFGAGVDYYLNFGSGKEISKEKALELLEAADRAGLVLQPSFSKKVANICCCCGCCCQVLKNIKRHPHPAALTSSAFEAVLDTVDCNDCGICLVRCQMDAIYREEEKIRLNSDACIGCGLCVSTCPGKCFELRRKKRKPPDIPDTVIKAAIQRGRNRGKMGVVRIIKLWLQSRVAKWRESRNSLK